jgi:hypothetical protein
VRKVNHISVENLDQNFRMISVSRATLSDEDDYMKN